MEQEYRIAGTHCSSCQIILEKAIGAIPNVARVRVDPNTGRTRVHWRGAPDTSALTAAVRRAGYSMGQRSRAWISTDSSAWSTALVASCIVFVGWIALKLSGLDALAAQAGTGVGVTGALIAGLTAGVSTCMALVGGLVLAYAARHAQKHPEATTAQKFRPHLFFNAGRILGFAVLGGAVGALGALARPTPSMTGWLILLAGASMLLVGLSLTGLFPRLTTLSLPTGIARRLGLASDVREYSHRGAMLTGALTFFVPCGFTQAAQLAALATGSLWGGALLMAAFAVGTAPGLLGVGWLSSAVRGSGGRVFFAAAGIAAVALGLWNMSNGWTLTGIVLGRPTTAVPAREGERVLVAEVRDGKQYVDMEQSVFGYSADRIVVKRGIPVAWRVESTNSYTCASSLNLPAMNIAVDLQPGQNIIEFTPTKTGLMRFSCSMGMYRGIIEVVE
ncbi:MAG: sulfite exporter TauE/SafE family protein [Candidatus Yanofskybacteria bacterium]|nr:sulfite exporter TauE/SafE family protein [Candidatus Yanofskybacteria bacterium]